MKILLATYWNIPHLGGVWNYMVQLKEKLESLNHTVDLLGYGDDNTSIHIVNQGRKIETNQLLPLLHAKLDAETYPVIHENNLVKYTEFQRYAFELGAAYLGLDQYDLIHTQDVISAACINRIKPDHIPVIATLHGSVAHEIKHQLTTIHQSPTSYMAKAYYDELEHLGAATPDKTIVANRWLRDILVKEFHVPIEQIQILHYGYDTEMFIKKTKQRVSFQRPANKKIIMYTGRLVELKGVQHLISALALLKETRDDWVCWIVGTGDMQKELQLQSKKLGLEDNIFFFGKRDNIPALLGFADIYVLPSLLENQPLSLIEAQLAGRAIIVSNTGGLPEMVEDGVTGIITPPADPKKLQKNIEMLLDDDRYRKRLGSNAKKWGLSHWSIDKGIKSLVNIYEQIIADKKEGDKIATTDNTH